MRSMEQGKQRKPVFTTPGVLLFSQRIHYSTLFQSSNPTLTTFTA